MQNVRLFLMMIFVYPVIFFTSLHVISANYELKYTLFQIWARFFMKRASAKVECLRADLIPLENDYIFVVNHNNALDALILCAALPVRTHFILEKNEKIPYLNNYLKRLKTIRFENSLDESIIETVENDLNESSITVFTQSIASKPLPISFYELALKQKWTLIPVTIVGSQNVMKKGKFHNVKVVIKDPLYYEEYEKMNSNEIEESILHRIQETD